MSKYPLKDILKNKLPGDEWYTLAAPEEVLFWQLSNPWPDNLFKSRGVSPISISVRSDEQADINREEFKTKDPLRLPCGVEMTGFYETKMTKKVQGRARIDSGVELNDFMRDLCSQYGLGSWEVFNTHIYNDKEGVEVEFKFHNPDGHGPGFYLFRIWKGKDSRLYPDVCLADQKRYVVDFYSNLSHCTAVPLNGVGHGCALEKKITKKQIVRRQQNTH